MSYKCDICDLKFKSKKTYKHHIDYDVSHLCRICLNDIENEENLFNKIIALMVFEEEIIKIFDGIKNKSPEQEKLVKQFKKMANIENESRYINFDTLS